MQDKLTSRVKETQWFSERGLQARHHLGSPEKCRFSRSRPRPTESGTLGLRFNKLPLRGVRPTSLEKAWREKGGHFSGVGLAGKRNGLRVRVGDEAERNHCRQLGRAGV